jgi:plasmid maintenance system antidote protein VapI
MTRPEQSAGQMLQNIIAVLGLSQAGMASLIGISAKHLNELIQGKANLTPEAACVISDGIARHLVAIDTQRRMALIRQTPGWGMDTDGET